MRFAIEPTSYAGYEARELVDTGGGLAATFLPGLGMVGVSLLHRGEELLGRTDNLPRYASEGSTLGIPLLHPWANRLGGSSYTAAGRAVELDPEYADARFFRAIVLANEFADFAGAQNDLQRYLLLEPDGAFGAQARELLAQVTEVLESRAEQQTPSP